MITARNVGKTYGSVVAMDDVCLSLGANDVVGLMGPNGAGKTTLFRLLSTMTTPDSGRIEVCGYDSQTQSRLVRAETGVIFSVPGLYDRLTARENLKYFGILYVLSGIHLEQQLAGLMKLLGIEEFCDRLAGGLSRGMRQRVALARAVLHEPSVLLLDEPTTGLDFDSAESVLEFLDSYKENRCIVFATHNFQEVSRCCNKLVVLNNGRTILATDLAPGTSADDIRSSVLTAIGGGQQ